MEGTKGLAGPGFCSSTEKTLRMVGQQLEISRQFSQDAHNVFESGFRFCFTALAPSCILLNASTFQAHTMSRAASIRTTSLRTSLKHRMLHRRATRGSSSRTGATSTRTATMNMVATTTSTAVSYQVHAGVQNKDGMVGSVGREILRMEGMLKENTIKS